MDQIGVVMAKGFLVHILVWCICLSSTLEENQTQQILFKS
jgi:hypothetical protein